MQTSSKRQIIILAIQNDPTSVTRIIFRSVPNTARYKSTFDIMHLISHDSFDFVQIFHTVIRVIFKELTGTHSSTKYVTYDKRDTKNSTILLTSIFAKSKLFIHELVVQISK
ncbi:hypothetical protein HHI36_022712 [Cryptolaemus montrouzieri]|uniref:Uncharacterized protein n=1 Tax=Cryptolaemus montrouzieri TaxID=559131 RepID=A0ABD2N0N7_9CUCU